MCSECRGDYENPEATQVPDEPDSLYVGDKLDELALAIEQEWEIKRRELIARLQICECGHLRRHHDEEQPYICWGLHKRTTFKCECNSFKLKGT